MAILNSYKDTLDKLIDSSDKQFLNQVRPIDERSCRALMFKGSLADLSEKDYLDENLLDRLSRLVPKIEDSQVR